MAFHSLLYPTPAQVLVNVYEVRINRIDGVMGRTPVHYCHFMLIREHNSNVPAAVFINLHTRVPQSTVQTGQIIWSRSGQLYVAFVLLRYIPAPNESPKVEST